VSARLAFIRPCVPSTASRPPRGEGWCHEPKWDGFRFQVIKDGAGVRMYSKSGAESTARLPRMVEAFGKLPTQSAILDGELCLIDPRGAAHFYRLMAQMRTSSPDESQLMFLVFDLLHQDGVDLAGFAAQRAQARSQPALPQVEGAVPEGGADLPRWPGVIRALQQVWF
jgi:bifunctional non-homologous end joining protein LigD